MLISKRDSARMAYMSCRDARIHERSVKETLEMHCSFSYLNSHPCCSRCSSSPSQSVPPPRWHAFRHLCLPSLSCRAVCSTVPSTLWCSGSASLDRVATQPPSSARHDEIVGHAYVRFQNWGAQVAVRSSPGACQCPLPPCVETLAQPLDA